MSELVIDDRLPVDSTVEPVDVKEEYYKEVEGLTGVSDQLGQVRAEMGRLVQVLGNLKDKANAVEQEMMSRRKKLLEAHNITDGQWVLDFSKKQLVKVEKGTPLTP